MKWSSDQKPFNFSRRFREGIWKFSSRFFFRLHQTAIESPSRKGNFILQRFGRSETKHRSRNIPKRRTGVGSRSISEHRDRNRGFESVEGFEISSLEAQNRRRKSCGRKTVKTSSSKFLKKKSEFVEKLSSTNWLKNKFTKYLFNKNHACYIKCDESWQSISTYLSVEAGRVHYLNLIMCFWWCAVSISFLLFFLQQLSI